MKKLNVFLAVIALGAMMGLTAPKQADARPAYLKAFSGKYEKVAEEAKAKKCGVCHGEGGKNKKVLSDYGKALGAALGEKNVKDAAAVNAALEAAAAKDAGDGKTYGDLLNAGTLPPAAE